MCADPIARWLDSGQPADESLATGVLRFPFNQTMLIRPPISMERGMGVLEDDREIGEYSSREPEIG